MVRRKATGTLAILVLSGLAAGAAREGAESATHATAPVRPNVVVIMTDDQTVESVRVMANVRQLLAAQGTTFANSFVSFSLCCPSRATFLTGQYNHNNRVMSNAPPDGGYYALDSSNTLPVWLQRAGYYTAHIGKYLNGYGTRNPTEVPPGWSEWRGSVDPTTYRFYGYTLNEGGTLRNYGNDAGSYQADVYTDKALDLIRRRAPQAEPFFLSVAYLAPHSGGPREAGDPQMATPVPAPRHRDRFASEALPSPPSFNEGDVSDKPTGIRGRRVIPPRQVTQIREMYQQRLESLLAVDEGVARIVAELERLGELDKTLIVFTADNGFFHGEHRVPNGKVLHYEPSSRVPLIVRGPGVPRGRTLSQLVANVDLAPTIVDAARATPARRLDGRSLLPLLRDPGRSWGRDLLLQRGGPTAQVFQAIRTPRYKYAEYGNGERELYDLAADPHELASKHADPAFTPVRDELARRLATLRRCAAATCRIGPRLAARLAYRRGARGCARSSIRATLAGIDARRVSRVEFRVGGKLRGADVRAPFTRVLARRLLSRRGTTIRLRAHLTDGHVVTYDRGVRSCS
jgi:N-acetylglucosamine-6-sulfatase